MLVGKLADDVQVLFVRVVGLLSILSFLLRTDGLDNSAGQRSTDVSEAFISRSGLAGVLPLRGESKADGTDGTLASSVHNDSEYSVVYILWVSHSILPPLGRSGTAGLR